MEKLEDSEEKNLEISAKIENEEKPIEYESFTASNSVKTRKESNGDEDEEEEEEEAEFKLPEVDWENLEAKLKLAQQEINLQNKRASLNSDREEIRRKLAMVSSTNTTSSYDGNGEQNSALISDYLRKPKQQHLLGQNLQICFMNELNCNDDSPTNGNNVDNNRRVNESDSGESDEPLGSGDDALANLPDSCSTFSVLSLNSSENSYDNILSQLQSQTKKALAKVPSEVRAKLQSEKPVPKNPSPIADIVGLPTYGLKRLERDQIVDMNIGQLQVIVNDLCNQIEKINEELKKMLIDRDDLYMQQDSLLVDVEDLTRRIQEYMLRYKNSVFLSMSNDDVSSRNSAAAAAARMTQSTSSNGLADKINSFLHLSHHTKAAANNEKHILNDDAAAQKSRPFQLSNLTNKLYRFTKKT